MTMPMAMTMQEQVRARIHRVASPILVTRCQQILRKFVQDEIKSGTVRMSSQRVQEVCFVLRRLLDSDGQSDGAQLMQLLPVFAEMVVTQELAIRELLQKILLRIAS